MKDRFEKYKTGRKVDVDCLIIGSKEKTVTLSQDEYSMSLAEFLGEYIFLSTKRIKLYRDHCDLTRLRMMGGGSIQLTGGMGL